jgi:hypothetical protein
LNGSYIHADCGLFGIAGAVLWVAFRKGASKPKPDFNRDDVLAEARSAGFQNLTLISLDADWSAFKFKVAEAL